MTQHWKDSLDTYTKGIPFGVLAYVREDQTPIQRSFGSFAFQGADVFFSTRSEAGKVKALEAKPQASFFLEADGQPLAEWKNILFLGRTESVNVAADVDEAVALLSARNPRFKERIEKNGLVGTTIFRLRTESIELVDYAKGFGFSQKISVAETENV